MASIQDRIDRMLDQLENRSLSQVEIDKISEKLKILQSLQDTK